MLSRIAESLFWIGRYIERADDTARILDIYLQQILEDATMSRDEGWRFLVLGRSIERADMTARLITTLSAPGATGPSWTTLLRSCGAYEAYLRTYRGRVTDLTAAEFLLLDRLFPRSMFFALASAEECLGMLGTGSGRVGTADTAHRLLGRARTAMEYRGVEEMLSDLPNH